MADPLPPPSSEDDNLMDSIFGALTSRTSTSTRRTFRSNANIVRNADSSSGSGSGGGSSEEERINVNVPQQVRQLEMQQRIGMNDRNGSSDNSGDDSSGVVIRHGDDDDDDGAYEEESDSAFAAAEEGNGGVLKSVRFVDPADDDDWDDDDTEVIENLVARADVNLGGWGMLITFHNLVVRVRSAQPTKTRESKQSLCNNIGRRCRGCFNECCCSCCSTTTSGGKRGRTLLDGCSGHFPPSTFTGILGPSGSGKTTLLDALARRGVAWNQVSQQKNSVLYDGRSAGELSYQGNRDIAYCEQFDALPGDLTIGELLEYTAYLRMPNSDAATRTRIVDGVAIKLGLIDRIRLARIGTASNKAASGGQRKRAAIAQSLMTLPRAFMLDEPCSGLDSTTSRKLMDVLSSLSRRGDGTTILATLHTPSEYEFALLDRLLLMVDGAVVYLGPAQQALAYLNGISPVVDDNRAAAAGGALDVVPPTTTYSFGLGGGAQRQQPTATRRPACTVSVSETILDFLSQGGQTTTHQQQHLNSSTSPTDDEEATSPGRWDPAIKVEDVLLDDDIDDSARAEGSQPGRLTQRDLVGPALNSPCAPPEEELTERRGVPPNTQRRAAMMNSSLLTQRRIRMATRWKQSEECERQLDEAISFEKYTRRYRNAQGRGPKAGGELKEQDSFDETFVAAQPPASTLHEIKGLLYWRGGATVRDRGFFPSRIGPRLLAALVIISVVHNVPNDTFAGWTQRQAILFLCVISMSMTMVDAAPFVFENRTVFRRERADNLYRSRSYFVYLLVLEMLPAFVHVTIFDCVLYFAIPFRISSDPEFDPVLPPFFYFYLLTYTLGWIAVAFAYTMASFASTMRNASAMMGIALMVCGMTSGFFVTKPEMPDAWRWFVYVNPLYYALRGLYKNEFLHFGAELCIAVPQCFLGNECVAEYVAIRQGADLLSELTATASTESGTTLSIPFSEEPFTTMFSQSTVRTGVSGFGNPTTCLAVGGCTFLESMYGMDCSSKYWDLMALVVIALVLIIFALVAVSSNTQHSPHKFRRFCC